MRQAVGLAMVVGWAVGCANPVKMEEQPHLDFGLPDNDLSMASTDLAVPPESGDLAQLVHHDLAATTADLTPATDLLPEPSCDDAGTTGHLFLAGVGQGNVLVTSRFDGTTWSAYQSQASATDVAETLVAARP